MTMLEKILYIADYIEPNRREIPGLSKIRQIVFKISIRQSVCLPNELYVIWKITGIKLIL